MKHIFGLLIVVLFFGGFFYYPEAVQWIFGSIFLVVFGLTFLIIAFVMWAWVTKAKRSKDSDEPAVTISPPVAMVGMEGQGISLAIRETSRGIEVKNSKITYALIIGALTFFGPGIILLFIFNREGFNDDLPWFVAALVILMVGGCCWLLVWNLRQMIFHQPSLLIHSSGIEFHKGPKLEETFWRQRTKRVFIKTKEYKDSDGTGTNNFILVLETEDGKPHPLCISCDSRQIEGLLTALRDKGYPADSSTDLP